MPMVENHVSGRNKKSPQSSSCSVSRSRCGQRRGSGMDEDHPQDGERQLPFQKGGRDLVKGRRKNERSQPGRFRSRISTHTGRALRWGWVPLRFLRSIAVQHRDNTFDNYVGHTKNTRLQEHSRNRKGKDSVPRTHQHVMVAWVQHKWWHFRIPPVLGNGVCQEEQILHGVGE